jgi:hypothetical protein
MPKSWTKESSEAANGEWLMADGIWSMAVGVLAIQP